ncbi:MAG: tetratricopeptide repeat protein [Dehalococcoidia bacterium]|nr:tetratricopeptide repeat protein [Dehalococcoidia bacterium]
MTFSIVALDSATGEIGVGVQSRAFAVGARVPHAREGVGAIATQATTNESYGPAGLGLLASGLSPGEAVARLTAADLGRDNRQLAILNAAGQARAYTGAACIPWCGHIEGEGFSAQGNMLAGPQVVQALADTFIIASGELSSRLLDALDAAQAAGGDARGVQSAAILVMRPIEYPDQTSARWVDVRVDDSAVPLPELRRLLDVAIANRHAQHARRLALAGRHHEAIESQQRAIAQNPKDDQLIYGLAQRYAQAGDITRTVEALHQAMAAHHGWGKLAAENPIFAALLGDPAFRRLTGS